MPVGWVTEADPVKEVPGDNPMSPEITVGPVFVMSLPARTANEVAAPRSTFAVAAPALGTPHDTAATVVNTRAREPVASERR